MSNAYVIGKTLEGVPTTMVTAFGTSLATPIWFTFWVDAGGRARQVAMDAPGHFMTDTYTSYNKPVDIVAPAGRSRAARRPTLPECEANPPVDRLEIRGTRWLS